MSQANITRPTSRPSRLLTVSLWPLVILAATLPGAALAEERPTTAPRPPRPWAGQVSFGVPLPAESALDGGFALQTRMGLLLQPNLQVGGLLDWHRFEGHGSVVRPSGFVLEHPVFDLFPLLGYAQYGGTGKGMTRPYVGGGVGYQLGFIEADNVRTEILDGFGWEAWAGVSRRLTWDGVPSKALIGIEAAYNRADVSGSVEDPLQGRRHETFDLSSWVVRVGFSFEAR